MGSNEEIITNKLLEIIADELYIVRKDKDDSASGPMSEWKQGGRDRLVKKIDDIRNELKTKL